MRLDDGISTLALSDLAPYRPEWVRGLLSTPEYWQGLLRDTPAEHLRISCGSPSGEPPLAAWGPAGTRDPAGRERARAQREIETQGYTSVHDFLDPIKSAELSHSSLALLRHGWPAPLLIMFDDAWHLARHLARAMRHVVNDDLVLRYEMFVYCVDATVRHARARGIPPHRDAPGAGFDQYDTGPRPRHCTAWLALTDTNVDNGCIRVVPANAETRPEADAEAGGVPLEVSAGTLLLWGGHVTHWGGIHDPTRATGPRVAFTCVSSVEPTWGLPPLGLPDDIDSPTLPDMETRLRFAVALLRRFGRYTDGSAVARIFDALYPENRRGTCSVSL
jgi:hypothetical protein